MIRFFIFCFLVNFAMTSVSATKGNRILEYTELLMGTDVRILVDSNESDALIKAVKSAYEEGNRLNKIFSDWDAESEISRFSKTSQDGRSFLLSK
jgi:thiamine biosynthesis lipoprotein ApbE